MNVKAELSSFLNHLPAVDGPDERKALLTFTGQSELGIYLDWQGSNVAFTERLLEELSRRGQGALSGFLAGLPNTLQVKNSHERQKELTAIRTQVDALDEAAFRAEFPVPLPISSPAELPPADPAMLAAAVVNEVLAPYYKLGAEPLRQQAGGRAVTLAKGMAEKVEPALASDLGASAVFDIFKQSPEAGQVGMLKVLKDKLAGDPSLAGELAALFSSAAAEPDGGGLRALVNVSHDIGLVRGDVVGAVVGADVLDKIREISVTEVIETVEPGGSVTGVVIGGSGPISLGGQHHHGNVFSGNFSGAMLNVGSSLQNVTQSIDNIQGADQSAKEELQDLVAQLTAALKQVPPDRVKDAEAVAGMTEDVVKRASADKPNSSLLSISAEGLKKAAENIADVLPTVLGIATQIVAVISGLGL